MRLAITLLKLAAGAEEVWPKTMPLGAGDPFRMQQPGEAAMLPVMLMQLLLDGSQQGQSAHPPGAAALQVTVV